MDRPSITIITPNLNHEQFLERALCSVLDQGYENLEYFVVDGGSTDESVDILKLYDEDLDGWTSRPDDGPGDAINEAMEEATGEIIGILPSVELYMPSAFDIVAEAFTDDEVQWVVGQCIHIDGGDDEISMQRPMKPDSLASYLRRDSGFLPTSCTFIRKAVLDLFGGFDPSLRFAYDYEMWAELLTAGIEPVLLDEPVGSRRQTPTRYSSADAVQRGFEFIEVARRFAHHLPLTERDALHISCDQRERIYTLANAEALGNRSRRYLLQQIMKHPAWMQDESVRRTLMHGTPALPLDDLERAA